MVSEIFEKEFGKGFRLFSAPGRINLIGEHTDYNLGYVLPGAIDRAIDLAIKPNGSNKVNLIAANLNKMVTFSVNDTDPDIHGWAKYPFGVIKELEKVGYKSEGFDAVFGGNIPLGAGLSSSAAVESVFAYALNLLFRFNLPKEELARIGQRAEHNYAGVKCGIMDQFASLFGKANHFIRLDCLDLSVELFPFHSKSYSILLIDTCVKHNLASSEYNTRRKQCEEGVSILSKHYPEVKSLRDVTPEMLREEHNKFNPVVFNRCEYVVEENQRLLNTCRALTSDNFDEVGKLLYGSHEGLRDKYEVSCKELDFLVDLASKTQGVIGARMMGGGFGGCTINLVKEDALENLTAISQSNYHKQFGKNPEFYRVKISDGAKELE